MESLLNNWDGETLVSHHDHETDAWIFIAIYSTKLGPGVGGTRMRPYPSLTLAVEDALRLGRGMAYKFAAAQFDFGGAKCVIKIPEDLDPALRPGLLQRYGALIQQLGGKFRTGPDMGTTEQDMAKIAEHGAPYVYACPESMGGSGDPGPRTALGVLAGIEVTLENLFGDSSVSGRKIFVQGVGDVGAPLVQFLLDAGAEVIFSDVDEATISKYREEFGLEYVAPENVYDFKCDIFAPCALGAILNPETIPQLNCKAVAGSANNQLLSDADVDLLSARGILYAPDYVINAGGAIFGAGVEARGWTQEEGKHQVREIIQSALRQIYEEAERENISTEVAAKRIAESRLA
jgi:leucine dehydrogenase